MRILLTGGAGYIGSHILVELLDAGHAIHVVDSLVRGHAAALDRVRELAGRGFGFTQADLRDDRALAAIVAEFTPEAVIHLAGLKSPAESLRRPKAYAEANAGGTAALLRALEPSGCRRLVFSSSAAVYGPPEYLPVDEDHPLNPITPYALSKLAAEQLLTAAAAADPAWSVTILRYFNPVGAHPSGHIGEVPADPPDNLVPYLVEVAAGLRSTLQIFGDDYPTADGTGVRDFLHVTDLARAHLAALEHARDHRGAAAFNLGTGRGVSVRRVVEVFAAVNDCAIPLRIAPRRAGDVAACYADATLAERLLGGAAEASLEAMCGSAWAWARANPHGYGVAARQEHAEIAARLG